MRTRRNDGKDLVWLLRAACALALALLLGAAVPALGKGTAKAQGKQRRKALDPYAQMWKQASNELQDKLYRVEPSADIVNALSLSQLSKVIEAGSKTYRTALLGYAQGRQRTLEYAVRNNEVFGPWDAYENHLAEEADPDGRITEWQNHYYITHDWSEYGQQILTIIPGDQVVINGRTMQVYNMFDYPKSSYSDEIWALVGADSVVIQTCDTQDETLNRIVYGYWTDGGQNEQREPGQLIEQEQEAA